MIEITNLRKSFKRLNVLNNINCVIHESKITAIIGPNGAGKTTLIKAVLGLINPDEGCITVDGNKLNGDWSYRKNIGYMPQLPRFPENLTVNEIIHMIRDLRNFELDTDDEIYINFNLDYEKNKKIRNLSGGTRQKVNAVIAFLFYPTILILDEPTAGLDPRASSRLKDKILKEKARGKTFILTSHIMNELEELADNIIFLLNGEIKFAGPVEDIMNKSSERKLERAVANMMGD